MRTGRHLTLNADDNEASRSDPGLVVVVLDARLPEIDSLDICRRLEAAPDEEKPAVVLITDPVDAEALVASVRSTLRERGDAARNECAAGSGP